MGRLQALDPRLPAATATAISPPLFARRAWKGMPGRDNLTWISRSQGTGVDQKET